MRKIILTLAVVLLAAPALADVEIILENLGGRVIQISYDATSESPMLVRALALNVAATDGDILSIDNFAIGDDNGGFGIMPGAFRDNISVNPTTGMVDSWVGNPNPYTPVAPAGDTDALGDLPGPGFTFEAGSLYETVAPGETGVLCTITVDENVSKVCVTGNAIRGNVVLEDASEAPLNPAEVCIPMDCFPNSAPYSVQFTQWEALSKPPCWCDDFGAVGFEGNQCNADGAGNVHRKGYIVYNADLAILSGSWKAKLGDANLDPCADFAHQSHRKGYVVYNADLAILSTNWKAKSLPGDCPKTDTLMGL